MPFDPRKYMGGASTVSGSDPGQSIWTPSGFGGSMGHTGKRDWDNSAAINAGAQAYATDEKAARFGQIFPWLTGQLGGLGAMSRTGGQSPPSPEITVGGVWNPQQTQQRVNAARAQNDQSLATQQRGNAEKLSAGGFGGNSPMLAALQGQAASANRATNTTSEREIRNTAAEQNAGHLLNTQKAREAQFASRQQEDIERRKPIYQLYSSLFGSIAGLA